MKFVRPFLVGVVFLSGASVLPAQEGPPVTARFLRVEKGQTPLPPLVHLSLELKNAAAEPRWILLSLSREMRLPKDGKFAADPEGGLPFFVLEAKSGDRGQAVMVGFLGEPRFSAFFLPAGAKVELDDFEFPSVEDLSEFDWLEARALDVDGKTPLEKWLPMPLLSTSGVKIGKDASWADVLRDSTSGEPRGDLPKDKVTSVRAHVVQGGRLTVAGFQARPRYYEAAAMSDKSELPANWSLRADFRPVRPFKVEHLAFAPEGSWLVASLQTFKVVGLDLAKSKELFFPIGERALARFFAFSPEGHLLVKQASDPGKEDAMLDLADWSAGKVFDVLRFSSRVTLGNVDHVPAPDGQKVAVAQRSSFNLWDFVKLETTNRLAWPESVGGFTYRTGLFSPDGNRFAAGLEHPLQGGKAIVWDVASGKVLAEFVSKQSGLQFLALSGDGRLLAGTGKQASAVWVWSVDAHEERAALRDIGFSNIHALALSPDGTTLAVAATAFAGGDATRGIELFDVASQKKLGTLSGLRQPVTALSFSRDSRLLAGGEQLGAIRAWQRK
jgi:hypothetical protein